MFRALQSLDPILGRYVRHLVRREIREDIRETLVSHTAARQMLDLYDMRLETLDTRLAKRIMTLEARVAELEARQGQRTRPAPVA